MLRSLHMKLVLIMILLVVCLMTITGAFLINSVNRFYLNEFYTQMAEVFSRDTEFVRDLVTAKEGETDGAQAIDQILLAKMGTLGVDGKNRNYYILDGKTGAILSSSDGDAGQSLEGLTPNLLIALNEGREGNESDLTANYMDLALPISRGGQDYIIYVLDQCSTVRELNSQLFQLIIESLAFGLVISVLLSFLLSKAMVNPIRALTRGVKRVAEGDFGHELQTESHDEIGVLTNAFNAMAGQLQTTIREVDSERTKLSTLFLHMTDGVVAFNQSGEVIHSNPAAEEMLDMAIPVGGAVTYQDLFGEIAPLETILTLDQDCLESETVRGERILLYLLAPFDREKQVGVLVVVHDVTQQVKNETMRKEFVANVSHELRTPITNIRSYAETLEENPDLPPEMTTGFLHVILNESDRMTHIVQDLLTLSRFDSGHSQLNLTTFPFADVLEDSYQAVRIEAQRHGHSLSLEGTEDLPSLRADRERVLQVIMNILSNAIKYTPDGGNIAMSAGADQDRVWLEVADNGIGIPPEDRERIFERFYRVDKARSRESGGTGLGLSIAQEIIRQHEGSLTLVDRPGPGTTLRMELKRGGPKP
ncbi:MAG: cell wall metabolism sensor histidine kinase WalK [Clostridiales bacterium]|nr:cell wall metabolism sensor histidine kinase WalK [Clostridiales bacterium]MDY4172613.1 ATP-binding protein [Evtepia sp.]